MATRPVTPSLEQLRADLLSRAEQPDVYPFISIAERYLMQVPQDDQIRALLVGALVRKGLVSVAVELAEACPSGSPQADRLGQVAEQLLPLPSEQIDWVSLQPAFEGNLAVLAARGEQAAALAGQVRAARPPGDARLTLHRANDGNFLVRGSNSAGQRLWLPAALDFRGQLETVRDNDKWRNVLVPPFLIDGVGMGWLVPRVCALSRHTYLTYSPAIYVVEPNLAALAVAMHLHDWHDVLADERVYLSAGRNAWNDWQTLVFKNESLPLPHQVTCLPKWPGAAPTEPEKLVTEVARQRASTFDEWNRRARELYAGRDVDWWARRYASAGPQDPLRVLGITSRFTTFLQHSMRDAFQALERAGLKTLLLLEEQDHHCLAEHAFLRALVEFQPDLILVLDHHRYEYAGRLIPDVPFVCWIQDDLAGLFNSDVGPRLGPLDFTIGYGLTQCVLNHGYPADRFMPCNVPIEPAKFAPPPGGNGAGEDSDCDVVYISHHAETPEDLHVRIRDVHESVDMRRLIDAFYEQTRELFASEAFQGSADLVEILQAVEARSGISIASPAGREEFLTVFGRPLADRTLRHVTLGWIADWAESTGRRLHIYGRNWDQHPRYRRYARGVAQHGEHLARIMRRSAINIHTGLNTALHQRVLETICAGGFILVRHNRADFLLEPARALNEYVRAQGIHRPMSVPIEQLPAAFVEDRRRKRQSQGRPLESMVELTPEYILLQQARRLRDERYAYASEAFPHFERLTFSSAAEFRERAEYFLAHPDERAEQVRNMQTVVHELFTYDSVVRDLLAFLKSGLSMGAGQTGSARG